MPGFETHETRCQDSESREKKENKRWKQELLVVCTIAVPPARNWAQRSPIFIDQAVSVFGGGVDKFVSCAAFAKH